MNNELNLFSAGKIAIPLKAQPESTLNPQPNFLIIENIFDYISRQFPNAKGVLEETECMNSLMKLVFREVLPAENGKAEEIREVLLDNVGNIVIPEDYVFIFKNHQRMIENAQIINIFLPMFQFRGILKKYKLEYDPLRSQEYLLLLEESKKPIVTPELIVTPITPIAE
jgi:hypothetical protein